LDTDDVADPKVLEKRHLATIAAADALYIYDFEGYIGASANMELGWALALGKPIYVKEMPADFTLNLFAYRVASPHRGKKDLDENDGSSARDKLTPTPSLKQLQDYVRQMVLRRGFDDESSQDVMLLMVEEIGELAKSLRKSTGLKVDSNRSRSYPELEEEIADVFIYLLDLCNLQGVDLFKAFSDKEENNEKREWKSVQK
jgi:NTP pyrophosphatase (non-canonical NTP hydrolase)